MKDVCWIKGRQPVGLAIVLRPRGEDALIDDLKKIARSGVGTLVSLLEPEEANWLGLREEGQLAEQAGLKFLSFAIRDLHVPTNLPAFRNLVAGLAERLRAGERIGMHCQGSIGRAPLTAACTLIHLGWSANDALAAIEAARGCPIPHTQEQLQWILNYRAEP